MGWLGGDDALPDAGLTVEKAFHLPKRDEPALCERPTPAEPAAYGVCGEPLTLDAGEALGAAIEIG